MLGLSPIAPLRGWGLQKPPLGISINRSHPLSDRLDVCWLFNEGAGRGCCDSVSGIRGLFTGTPFWQASAAGIGVNFNNSSSAGTSGIALTGWRPNGPSHTFCFWVNVFARYGGTLGQFLLDFSTPRMILAIEDNAGTALMAVFNNGVWRKFDVIPVLNRFFHLAFVLDSTTSLCRVFCDGRQLGTDTTFASQVIGGTTMLGNRYDVSGATATGGVIHSFTHWNRALSGGEILQHYTDPYCMFEAAQPIAAGAPARPLINGSFASHGSIAGALV